MCVTDRHDMTVGVKVALKPQYIQPTNLTKSLAALPRNHCRNNGQRLERNESCRNDHHQSSERILAEKRHDRGHYFTRGQNLSLVQPEIFCRLQGKCCSNIEIRAKKIENTAGKYEHAGCRLYFLSLEC